jgi:protein associated with RNAse G/E
VLVAPDFSFRVLDEDEFELHAELYRYPPEFRHRASEALAEVLDLLARRQFPFISDENDEAL